VNGAAQVSGPKGAAAAAAEDPTDAAAAVGVAHGRVVSSLMRKHLVGVVVPIALQLKRQLEAARHPLLGDLMLALASLLADHKHEVGFELGIRKVRVSGQAKPDAGARLAAGRPQARGVS
jgi:hypothetical protein